MKTVKNMAAQGDVMFIRVNDIPGDALVEEAKDGYLIVAHSEMGHNHVVESRNADMLIDKANAFLAYLVVKEPSKVEHKRSFDTHETLLLTPGKYQIRRQREYVAEGFRRVAD